MLTGLLDSRSEVHGGNDSKLWAASNAVSS